MDINERINELQYRYILFFLSKKEVIDFAVDLLCDGYENNDICILAGLDDSDMEEVMEYFFRVVKSLNLEFSLEKSEKDLECYGINMIEKYQKNEIEINRVIRLIDRINAETNYSTKLGGFIYVIEDKLRMDNNETTIFNPELRNRSFDDFFFEFSKTYIEFIRKYDFDSYKNIAYCNRCRSFEKIEVYKKESINYWGCAKCKSKDYISIETLTGMKLLLEA